MGRIIASKNNLKKLLKGEITDTLEGGYYDVEYIMGLIDHDYIDDCDYVSIDFNGREITITFDSEHDWIFNVEIDTKSITKVNKTYPSMKGIIRLHEIDEFGSDEEKIWYAQWREYVDSKITIDSNSVFDDKKVYAISGKYLNDIGITPHDIQHMEIGDDK